jgi:hypothetical protein
VTESAVSQRDYEWDRDSLDPATVRISLPADATAEVEGNRSLLADIDVAGATQALQHFPRLAAALESIRDSYIENAPGFCVIDGSSTASLTDDERRGLYLLSIEALGRTLSQNAAGDHIVEVFDRGQPFSAGGRYHQTNASGVLHSDSPQWPVVPDYVALLCVRTAKQGGESKFISAYSVLDRVRREHPGLVDELSQPFLFDKRGDFAAGEAPVTPAPIVSTVDGLLHFGYLRSYIDSGHQLSGVPLTARQTASLDALDEVLSREELVVSLRMEPGDIQVLNNHFVVHDRRPFVDHDEAERRRLMLRAWLQRR